MGFGWCVFAIFGLICFVGFAVSGLFVCFGFDFRRCCVWVCLVIVYLMLTYVCGFGGCFDLLTLHIRVSVLAFRLLRCCRLRCCLFAYVVCLLFCCGLRGSC